MDENEEILDEKMKEMYSVIGKSQEELVQKFEKYMENDKYEKELETLRQLCQKIMDLYQVNAKSIENLENDLKGFKEEKNIEQEKEIQAIKLKLEKQNAKQFAEFKKQFNDLTIKVKELTPVQKLKKIIIKILESKKELEEEFNSKLEKVQELQVINNKETEAKLQLTATALEKITKEKLKEIDKALQNNLENAQKLQDEINEKLKEPLAVKSKLKEIDVLNGQAEKLEQDILADRELNKTEFERMDKKHDKDLKDLIDQFNESLQNLKEELDAKGETQKLELEEKSKKQEEQFDDLMKQLNDALAQIQEEVTKKKEEIDEKRKELEETQERKLKENQEEIEKQIKSMQKGYEQEKKLNKKEIENLKKEQEDILQKTIEEVVKKQEELDKKNEEFNEVQEDFKEKLQFMQMQLNKNTEDTNKIITSLKSQFEEDLKTLEHKNKILQDGLNKEIARLKEMVLNHEDLIERLQLENKKLEAKVDKTTTDTEFSTSMLEMQIDRMLEKKIGLFEKLQYTNNQTIPRVKKETKDAKVVSQANNLKTRQEKVSTLSSKASKEPVASTTRKKQVQQVSTKEKETKGTNIENISQAQQEAESMMRRKRSKGKNQLLGFFEEEDNY